MKTLAITTGDIDGIGLEVSVKSLIRLGPQKNTLFFLFRSKSAPKNYLRPLDQKFKRLVLSDPIEALSYVEKLGKKPPGTLLIDICSDDQPPEWVESAATLCQKKKLSGMATAPLSKELIASLGWKDRGHTEILKRVSNVPFIHQGFAGEHFNVVLATSHIPLKEVSSSVREENLLTALKASRQLQEFLPTKIRLRPIVLLGLNPHAGEKGILGVEEQKLLIPFCNRNKIAGPISPDAAFLEKNWDKYSVFIACYHDQGLIPFKMIHGQNSGVQLSLGLSFPRTSVDHGTAKDIFGKNKANANSMFEAIQFALRMIRK